jgi:hypothetical protein
MFLVVEFVQRLLQRKKQTEKLVIRYFAPQHEMLHLMRDLRYESYHNTEDLDLNFTYPPSGS